MCTIIFMFDEKLAKKRGTNLSMNAVFASYERTLCLSISPSMISAILLSAVPWYSSPTPIIAADCTMEGVGRFVDVAGRRAGM